MRVLEVEGPGPVTVNVADYDVVVFHTSTSVDIDKRIHFVDPMPDPIHADLLQVRVIQDAPKLGHEKISARQSWRDPWPGRHR